MSVLSAAWDDAAGAVELAAAAECGALVGEADDVDEAGATRLDGALERAVDGALDAPAAAPVAARDAMVPEPPVEEVQPATSAAIIRAGTRWARGTRPPSHARRLESDTTDRKAGSVAQRGGQFGGGGQPNMQQLMKQAQKMQEQLAAAQAELAEAEVTGTAGGGLVTATLNGGGELTALTIDPKAVDPDDVETLQDLVVAAVRDAHRAVAELTEQKMGPLAGGLGGLGLPGL